MKKVLLGVMLVIALVIFTGCDNKGFEFDMKKASDVIESKITGLEEISKETLEDVYDVDFNNVEKFVFKENKDGDFYAIIKAKDNAKVKVNMKEYFDKVKYFSENYSPERLELLDNRLEKEIDSYLIYIIHKDAENIYNEIIK